MNALQDPSKKTSINALLNPQDVSTFSSISGLASAPLVASSGHSPNPPTYYPTEFANPSSFNLRAASWDGSDDTSRRKSLIQPHMSRYHGHSIQPQHPQMSSQPPANNYIYAATSRMIRPRMDGSQGYAGDGNMWTQPTQQQHHDSSNLSYGPSTTTAMYSDERTALSADYSSSTSDYPSAYDNQPSTSVGNPQLWQTTERVSVRLAARGTSAQPVSDPHDEHYSRSGYYPSTRMYNSSMDQQQQPEQQQLGVSIPPSGPQHLDSIRSSSSTSTKRSLPDSETTPGPKPKRTKAKAKAAGTEPSTSTPIVAPSKRGYNAKKRSEAAFISAQNDALQRAQREGSQRQNGQGESTLDRDSYPSDPLSDNRVTGAQYYVPELQFARCMSNRYRNEEFPRCISCTRRWAGDTCRFQGIRYFMRDAQKKLQGVSFNEHHSMAQAPIMDFPKTWNRSLEMEHVQRTKFSIAKALLPVLKAEQEHLKAAEIVRRPRECDVRVTCDTCITSLFSTSFMCRLCGREVCNDCFQLVRDLTQIPQNPTPAEVAAFNARREKNNHGNPFFLNCLKRNEHGINEFTPVTRFVEAELDQAISEMEAILAGEVQEANSLAAKFSLDDTSLGDGYPLSRLEPTNSASKSQLSSTIQTTTHSISSYPAESFADPLTSPIYDDYTPTNTPEHIVTIPIYRLQIIPASLYDPVQQPSSSSYSKSPRAFSALWKQGLPLLVKDVLPRFKLKWTPQYFMDRYGDQSCLIVECQTDENTRITVRDFFAKFGKYADREKCWKLKDWPPTADFKKTFPELFEDFSQAVPVPDYVRRDGVYNIGSHFPSNAIGPDLGPKMYNALASSQEVGSKGSTKLHMDMADALNVMLYSTACEDGNEGYAVWDLFRAEDSDKIRAFLKKKFGYGSSHSNANGANGNSSSSSGAAKKKTSAVNGQPAANGSGSNAAGEKAAATHAVPPAHLVGPDPIHGQQFYLDVELRRQLFDEYGVKSYRVYQRPGDGVFIPAGCAHQVANMSDCIKIAIDFVSPENIDRCEKLTKEFREQNQSKVWKEDVLQLRTMMWFAWQSCSRKEKELDTAARLGP